MREIDVTGLQCTQAVMAVLREIVSMQADECEFCIENPYLRTRFRASKAPDQLLGGFLIKSEASRMRILH